MISFFRVSGVPQKGEARTPLTRKKEITRTKSSPKDAGTVASTGTGTDTVTGTDAGTVAGTVADAGTDAGTDTWHWHC
ncbi:MAG: hypothetical protein JRG70_12045 [Deltaproteobacteria bacterium]|nr:hypothetical protein [Deltaproteobacteria bacterium]